MTQEQDRNYSRAEVAGMVQASLALCATCSHARGEHEGDRACLAQWDTGPKESPVHHVCRCEEFWPIRDEREDGIRVTGHELAIGGSWELVLNRRVPSELWDSMRAGRSVELRLRLGVRGKAFKEQREKGVLVGLVAVRKLKVERVFLVDEETGELS